MKWLNRKALIIANVIGLIGLSLIYIYPQFRGRYHIEKYYGSSNTSGVVVNSDCLPRSIIESRNSYLDSLTKKYFKLQHDGTISYNYGSSFNNAGWRTTPLHVARFGMDALRTWCEEQDEIGLAIALQHADWLVENAKFTEQNTTVWQYDFPVSQFQTDSGWTSGMANAYDIAFLTQMFHLTQYPEYLKLIKSGILSFDVDIDEGGVKATMDDGKSVFFEEYAQPGIEPGHVLNGHMFAVAGLKFVGDYFEDHIALKLFKQGAEAVAVYAPKFDTGEATYYSLGPESPHEADITDYPHRIHTRYMAYYYNELGDPVFREYALKWAGYMGITLEEEDGKFILNS